MNTHTATANTQISDEKRHSLIAAVAAAHGTSDAVILRRIKAVSAALTAGLDVKSLVSEIKAVASVPGSSVTPVSAAALGQARAVLTFLDRVGVSLPTALETNPAALVSIYRAAHADRAGVKGIRAMADAAVEGATSEDKLSIGATQAETVRPDSRPVAGKRAEAPSTRVTVTDYAAVLNTMAGAVGTGAYEPTADFVAALGALVSEVQRVAAARPVRARIAAPVPA